MNLAYQFTLHWLNAGVALSHCWTTDKKLSRWFTFDSISISPLSDLSACPYVRTIFDLTWELKQLCPILLSFCTQLRKKKCGFKGREEMCTVLSEIWSIQKRSSIFNVSKFWVQALFISCCVSLSLWIQLHLLPTNVLTWLLCSWTNCAFTYIKWRRLIHS